MDSRKVKRKRQYLHTEATEIPFSVPRVTRYPLTYEQNPVPPINFARLPEHNQVANMELAYRQRHYLYLRTYVQKLFAIAFFAGLLFPYSTLIFNQIPMNFIIGLSAGITFVVLLIVSFRAAFSPNRVVRALLFPLLAFVAMYAFGMLFQYRMQGAVLMALLTLGIFIKYARIPFDYYSQWAHAHPRLRPISRLGSDRAMRSPNYIPLVLALGAAIFLPMKSNSLAIGVVYAISIFFGFKHFRSTSFRQMRKVLSVFLEYKLNYRTPGLWFPHVHNLFGSNVASLDEHKPKIITFVLLFSLTLTLSATLSLFSIWDFPAFHMHDIFKAGYLAQQTVSPSGWIAPVFQALNAGYTSLAWTFPIAIAVGLTLPIFLFMAVYGGLIGESIQIDRKLNGYYKSDGKRVPGLDEDERNEWQWYIDRLSQSKHVATDPFGNSVSESAHMFMGIEPNADFPVLLDRKALSEHCYIVGETGSGKTALGITPLLIQLLRGHRSPGDKATPSERPPIVILDLKGDPALFNTAREEAKVLAKKSGEDINDIFRFFTPEPNKPSFFFNPLDDFYSGERSFQQLASLLLESLNLSHGEGYGRSYFTRRNRQLLYAALDKGRERGQAPQNIDELYEIIYELSKESEYKDASELVATLHSLSRYKLLSPTPEQREHSIHMPDVLNKRQIIYFWLPSAIESTSVREIGKMAVYAMLSAAIARQQQGLPLRQAYLFIDEFQQLAGENFKIILQQARSYGISNILANQSLFDLDTPDSDLRSTVQTNTRVKMFFSVTGAKDVNDLSKLSGEEIAILQSSSMNSAGGSSESFRESLKPRLTTNDIMQISDHPLEYILQISRGVGYSQFGGVPIPVRCTWPLSIEEYARRQETAWPTLEELGIAELAEEQQAPTEKDRIAELERHRRLKMFEEVWRKRRGEAVPETV